MAEDNVKIVLSAEDQATAAIKKLMGELQSLKKMVDSFKTGATKGLTGLDTGAKLQADFTKGQDAAMRGLRQRFTFESRMSRQRLAEERAVGAEQARQDRARRTSEDASMRRLRDQLAFATRMTRQRDADERRSERDRASAAREVIRLDNYRFGLRQRHERELSRQQDRGRRDLRSRGRDVWSSSRDAARDLVRMPAAAGAAGVAAGIGGSRKAMRAESAIDAAEINARIYADLSGDAARKLRDQWAAPLAESLGTGTDKMLSSYTEALKLGIPKVGAEKFAELATKTSEAWSVEFGAVVDILGTTNSLLTSDGSPFDFDKLKSVANTMQHLAAKQSTTPEKLISYLQRGAGGAKVLGMSQEAGLAFGSASTSLGNQAGSSGRLMDYMASRIIELPKLTRGHGEQARDARRLVQSLGYGSADALDRQRRKDPDAFLPEFVERFKRIKDPKQRDQAIRFFAGREWLGEFGRMVTGFETYREAVNLSKEAKGLDAISQVWELHKLKLSFIMKQINAGFTNILGEAGKAFTPLGREVGDYIVAWSAQFRQNEGLAKRVSAALQGMIEGFGFTDIKVMLTGILGKPGEGTAGSIDSWKATAKAFTSGISDVIGGIKSTFSAFTGGDPEVMARWTGRIVALTGALVLLGPVIGVLGSLGAFVTAIARGGIALGRMAGLGGLGARAGGAALFGASTLATIGGGIAVGFMAEIARRFGVLQMGGKGLLGSLAEEFVPAPLRRWLDGDKKGDVTGTGPGSAGTGRGSSGTTGSWGDPDATVQKQSYRDTDLGSLIKKASYTAFDDRDDETRRLTNFVEELRNVLQKASLTPGSGPVAGLGASSGGGGGSPVAGLGGKFFTPEGMKVPDWYGKGRGASGGAGRDTASPDQKSGGSRSWRNNNPGNIEYGPFARSMGATGTDGRFAKFPSYDAGRKAQEKLLFESKGYKDLTLSGAIRRWAPASENNVPAYLRAMGGDPGKRMSEYTPEQRAKLLDAMQAHEGWRAGTVTGGGKLAGLGNLGIPDTGLTTDGPIRANLMHGQFGAPGENLTGIRSKSGRSAQVNKASAPAFQGFIDEMESLGYKIKDLGGFNNRDIRGVSGRKSQHAYGNAIDLNPGKNPLGTSMTDMPEQTRALAKKYGLIWGMDWKGRKDPMHFEWNGTRPWLEQQKAVAGINAIGEKARRAQDGGVERLAPAQGEKVDVGGGLKGVPFGGKLSTDEIVGRIPAGVGRGSGAVGGGGSGGNTIHYSPTINGAGDHPEVVATKVQQALDKSMRNHAYASESV